MQFEAVIIGRDIGLLTIFNMDDGIITQKSVKTAVTEPEHITEIYFEEHGRKYINVELYTSKEELIEALGPEINKWLSNPTYDYNEIFIAGVPDFITYDPDMDKFFFVEVKGAGSGLSETQLQWMRSNGNYYPTKIIYAQQLD